MISNVFIFIFGTAIFGAWIVASFLEFRKMEEHPENYRKRAKMDFPIDKTDKKEEGE